MKRVFDEISDEEWSNHSFKPSRVFTKPQTGPSIPPPIESFAYRSHQLYISDESSDDCVVVMESSKNYEENLEDEDVEVEGVKSTTAVSRGRRFVVDDEDEESERELTEVYDVKSTSDDELEEDREDDDDVVGKALQKCAKLSAELKRELYGSSVSTCERYSEVESSSVRIVTQVHLRVQSELERFCLLSIVMDWC
ncbi:protein CHROMATIN REMODELING 19 isoform X3 [Cucumis melo var. makuwa]|uniref:Protein CHROMATIN REMODELING 19 isoform X3 n=1 Tax=Cucumis melo var. makuwa TaxID=1194695 RepID=A0A5A7VJ30_CUCMM|nr:protein CHROMATIN REMODELING 19 isoform X3 [Cucumis melo var. makuwa]TYK26016.1 protein CHROMATIN REMODELING 19 isoform X3 [Cucumis melo var. makuwa]